MRGFALGLILAVLFLVVTAHAQPACDIASKVCFLDTSGGFDPNPDKPGNDPDNKSPACVVNPTTPVPSQPFIDAFNAAPDGIKTSLCQLKNIFVTTDQRWGRFNDPLKHGHGADPRDQPNDTYIAIPQQDVGKTFSTLQDKQLKTINSALAQKISHKEQDTLVEFGLLYELAHESGHILWHNRYPLGGTPMGIACYDSNFGSSWKHPNKAKSKRWVEFADQSVDDHKDNSVPMPGAATTVDQMVTIYKSFSTALASANPEEDFVDTYSLEATFTSPKCTAGSRCSFTIDFGAPQNSIKLSGSRATIINNKNNCAITAISALHPAVIRHSHRHKRSRSCPC